VQVYHPAPDDLWRWTHTGLERLFEDNGAWSGVTVRPSSGTAACLGMLLGTFMHLLAKRAGAPALAKPAIAALNIGAEALDRRVAALREPQPGTIFANYHVIAEVAS
jgi:predicted trehalose synthase